MTIDQATLYWITSRWSTAKAVVVWRETKPSLRDLQFFAPHSCLLHGPSAAICEMTLSRKFPALPTRKLSYLRQRSRLIGKEITSGVGIPPSHNAAPPSAEKARRRRPVAAWQLHLS